MKLIEWINGKTKLNKTTFDDFQNNINDGKQDKIIEGTWTPVLTTLEGKAPTMEYLIQRGKYKKIGSLTYISFYIRGKITALNGTSNYAVITGVPYKSPNYMVESPLNPGTLYNLVENAENLRLLVNESTIRVQYSYGEVAAVLKVTPTSGGGYFQISGSGWYETE